MSSSKKLSKAGRQLGMCLLAAVAATTIVGCTGVGATTDFNKGFLDPTAVGRYQKQPLARPILSSLDRNLDVADDRYRNATDVTAEDLNPATTDYAIGRNDLISVAITDLVAPNVETVRTNRVSESGMISLPLIGQVKAAGLTEAQLEKRISDAYRQANVIQNAQVSVSVTEARARTFSILGAVTAPGQYAILNSEFRVLDALVLGRDVNAQGVDYIYVIRQLDKQEPTTAPSEPETAPKSNEDVLTPRSAVEATGVILAQASPTTTGASGALTNDNQKIITVDGKQVTVDPATRRAVSVEPTGPAVSARASTPAVSATARAAAPVVTPTTRPTAAAQAAPARAAAPSNVAPTAAPTVAPAATAPAQASAPTAPQGQFEFRDPVAEGKTRIIRIPFDALRNGDLRYNIVVKPYDLIFVPTPVVGEYYMGGHVARVGVYSLTARKITLKQAIVSAGMFDQVAIPAQTDVIRRVGEDHEIFVKVDLDKVFAGEQPDIYLRPNDVVQVGTSWWAPFVAAVRGGFRMTYGFGFLYDRNWGDPDTRRYISETGNPF